MTMSMNQQRPVLYINILVHDASEAVKNEVVAKVKKSRIPFPLKESVANRAAARVTLSSVVERMGPRLCQEIPIKMARKGIQVHVENVFKEENYLVLELQVQHVDAIVMSEAKHKKQQQEANNDNAGTLFFKGIFSVIGVKHRDSFERDVLPAMLQKKVSVSIREMMKEKLTEKKMAADVEIRQEEKQARFFYQMLRAVRANCATVDVLKKSSSFSSVETSRKSSSKRAAAPSSHVKKASLTDSLSCVVEAATSVVAIERTKTDVMPPRKSKRESSDKKGHRRSKSLTDAVEAAAATVVASVKNSTDRSEKERAYATMVRKRDMF